MSMINALCSELTLTVRKREETLEMWFRNGKLLQSHREAQHSQETGMSVLARINANLHGAAVTTAHLETWLQGVLITNPALKLYFNGQLLQSPNRGGA